VSRIRAAAVLALVALVAAAPAAAAAKKLPSTTYVDKSAGYRITIPTKWQVVPPSVAAVKAKVTQLKKQKKTDLAAAYSDYVGTASARAELTQFRFRAFMWPALPSPVPTDVSVRIQPVAKTYKAADLPRIAAVFRKELVSPGATVSKTQLLDLPAGRAAMLTGTVPLGKAFGGARTGFTLILILRPGRLYLLSFRIDSRAAKDANVFASITQLFRFV
jgi:hypothetical protein